MLRISRAKPVASKPNAPRRQTASAWRGPVRLLVAPGALVATIAFSCHDKDSIWLIDPNGSGGSSGGTGTAGNGNGGGGSGGNGGSGMAGAAGTMGGTAGSGTGGSAGAAGSGNGGSAGSGAGSGPLPGDAGPDSGGPDSGGPQPLPTATTQAEAVSNICVLLDRVPSCPAPADPCTDNTNAGWDGIKGGFPPACGADIDAYFFCAANAADANYDCAGDNTPEIAGLPGSPGQTGSCADEEAAYFAIFDNTNPCTQ